VCCLLAPFQPQEQHGVLCRQMLSTVDDARVVAIVKRLESEQKKEASTIADEEKMAHAVGAPIEDIGALKAVMRTEHRAVRDMIESERPPQIRGCSTSSACR
jgi:hypothetical protein